MASHTPQPLKNMRAIILLTTLFYSLVSEITADGQSTNTAVEAAKTTTNENSIVSWHNADYQKMIDSWAKGGETNGMLCAVSFARPYGNKEGTLFYVYVINATTNYIYGFIHIPFEAFANIALYDSQGKPVAKTDAGKKVGSWTEQKIEEWVNEIRQKRNHAPTISGSLTDVLWPSLDHIMSKDISVSHMFQLKQSGEYTLHLQMRFVQNKPTASGEFHLQITWLPEVVAKVQILPQDIPLPDLPPSIQTNSPAK